MEETVCRELPPVSENTGPTALTHLHDNMEHAGVERSLSLARARFYWPFMKNDIEEYVTRKCCCIQQKQPSVHERAPLGILTSSSPLKLVCIDFLHLEPSRGGYEYILAVILLDTRRHIQPKIRQANPLLTRFLTSPMVRVSRQAPP